MPQIHDSPPSTADPDPVRVALTDPKVLGDLLRHAKNCFRKMSGQTTRTQLTQDADDVVCEVIRKALEKAARFDPSRGTSAISWVHGFIGFEVQKRVGRPHKDRAAGGDEELIANIHTSQQVSIDDLILQERRSQVKLVLAKMKPRDRELLTLNFFDDLDSHEIAQRLQIAPGTFRVRLMRARDAFKALFDPTDEEGQS